ncbi:hypothetical protein [Streptomyces sp. GbtcB6]|uniref:hypothetical protein n=1 Tax=Streptomyces sp. GbtcB6 TaxID=2824751 RepID=UPI0020C68E65|nr:hypothetical protein [Streptomyces sp. GbtcB6]
MSLRKNSRNSSRQRAQRALAHNGWSRACLVSVLLVLLLTTATLGLFGIGDLTSAFTFPGRLTGAVLVAVAFTSFLGAAALVDHWLFRTFANSGLVALVGAFAAVLANVTLFLELLNNADSVPWKVLFGALASGSAWAVFAVWRTLAVIPAPKRVATALLVTTVIAAGNFGYQNLYLPSQHEVRPVVRLITGTPVPSPDRKAFSVPVDITLENHSDLSFDVLGTEFHAMAQRVPLVPQDRLRQQWRATAEQWKQFEGTNPLSRREIYQPGDLVQAQPWMRYGGSIDANDTVSARVVVQLPKDTEYDQVAFYASAHLTRKDRVSLNRLEPAPSGFSSWGGGHVPDWLKRDTGFDSLIYESSLRENNAIDAETRDTRHITVYWKFGEHGVNITETISTAHGKDESDHVTQNRYGIRIVETGPVERTLWDIKSKL